MSLIVAEELTKSVPKKFKRRKVYARFKDNICAANLAEMESLSEKNKNIKCVIDLPNIRGSKPEKDKKIKTVLNAFSEIVNLPNCKLNKLLIDQ